MGRTLTPDEVRFVDRGTAVSLGLFRVRTVFRGRMMNLLRKAAMQKL